MRHEYRGSFNPRARRRGRDQTLRRRCHLQGEIFQARTGRARNDGLKTSQHVENLHCVDRWCCFMDVWPTPGFWHPSLLPSLPRLLPSHQSGDGDSPMVIVGFLPRTYLKHRMTIFELSSSCGLLIVLRSSFPRHRKAEERGMAAIDEEMMFDQLQARPNFPECPVWQCLVLTRSGQTAVDQRQRWRQNAAQEARPGEACRRYMCDSGCAS